MVCQQLVDVHCQSCAVLCCCHLQQHHQDGAAIPQFLQLGRAYLSITSATPVDLVPCTGVVLHHSNDTATHGVPFGHDVWLLSTVVC